MRHIPAASLLLVLLAPAADAGPCETDRTKVGRLTHYLSPYEVSGPPPGYDHDRFGTAPVEIEKTFSAYFSSFDGPDDDNGDGEGDILAIPQFVAYQIDAFGELDEHGNFARAKTWAGPKPWYADDSPELRFVKEQPGVTDPRIDTSYESVGTTWNRGHLAMKLHTARLGKEAQCNSFLFRNAVPQAAMLNQGPWLDLEYWTGAAANRYGSLWVIAGPVFDRGEDIRRIGKPGRIPLAVPDAMFKVVARDGDDGGPPEVIAFIYPNHGCYRKCSTTSSQPYFSAYDHEPFMVSLAEVEEKTGLTFFSNLQRHQRQELLNEPRASELWKVGPEHVPISCRKREPQRCRRDAASATSDSSTGPGASSLRAVIRASTAAPLAAVSCAVGSDYNAPVTLPPYDPPTPIAMILDEPQRTCAPAHGPSSTPEMAHGRSG